MALELTMDAKLVENVLVLSLSVPDRFNLDEVMKVQGVKGSITGKMGELVKLFTEVDELEAVKQGHDWLSSNSSYLENFGQSLASIPELRLSSRRCLAIHIRDYT